MSDYGKVFGELLGAAGGVIRGLIVCAVLLGLVGLGIGFAIGYFFF